jgi:hypothetical protein
MDSSTTFPPSADKLLRWSLTAEDYEVISGDLLEELQLSKSDRAAIARLWFQVFVVVLRLGLGRRVVMVLGAFSAMAFSWFAFMEIALRHPYFAWRLGFSVLAVALGITTMVSLRGGGNHAHWRWVQRGWLLLAAVGAWAFVANLRATDFEGYIALMSAALVAQGVLCALVIPPVRRRS